MSIRVRGGKIEFRGENNFEDLYNWARANPSHAKALTPTIVELTTRAKIKNNSQLDTSNCTLIINHRLEDDWNSRGSSGKWINNNGTVIVQGSDNIYSEWWVPFEWNNVHVIVNKPTGKVSFFRSEMATSRFITTVRNTKYFIQNGDVDAHLQLDDGKGILRNVTIESSDNRGGFLLVRDTDTDGMVVKGLNLGGWSNLDNVTTFHKNMVMDHGTDTDKDNIPFLYRRRNWPVFYNVTNETTQTRKKFVDYRNPGVWDRSSGNACIVGLLSPTLIDAEDNNVNEAHITVTRTNDNTIVAQKVTKETGKIDIRNNHSNDMYKSLSWGDRDIYEADNCYIIQSKTTKNSGPETSRDEGEFEVRIRRPELRTYNALVSFHSDMVGEIVMFRDTEYKGLYSSYSSSRTTNTAEELYDNYKLFLYEFENMHQEEILQRVGNTIITDYSITINKEATESIVIDNENKLITLKCNELDGNLYSRGGMVKVVNGAKVLGTVEDANGCRVRIFAKQGGRFNIVAKRADNDFTLAEYNNVESCDVHIDRGIDIKFAMWQVGHQVYADVIKTDNGGINYYAPMVKNPYINSKVDVRPILANVRVALDYPYFIMYFDQSMSLDIEEIKAMLHYIVGSKESLTTSMNTGTTISTIEILRDEIKVNLPFVKVERGATLAKTDRVELNGFINTTDAKKLDPDYVINPSNADGLYVQTLAVKPALDPAMLGQVVSDNTQRDLTILRGQLIQALKG